MIDHRLIGGLHVEAVRRAGLHAEVEPHVLFQTSTIGALLEGAFDGDVTFAELAEHGDLGLGTLNGLDGEMIALEGSFLRADADGAISVISPAAGTPFAVVVPFAPEIEFALEKELGHAEFVAALDARLAGHGASAAVRVDGRFGRVHARSVPRQERPYPTLAEAAKSQHVFDFTDVDGTLVGFRFPDHVDGVEITGWHLHFVDAARERGGHVLSCAPAGVRVQLDPSGELHMELPPGV
ncbi:MAG: acetolactate decarboxylase, partial [Thermoleophilaceae bacterium]|nr:acetolactate decarboxylase [Thermoleophilaceae bacterium]